MRASVYDSNQGTAIEEAAMNRILQAQTALLMAGVFSSLPVIWSQPRSDFAKSFASSDVSTDVPSEEIQRRASAGHLREELELARDYYVGHGVARDLNQSAYWYRKAAEQGDPGAQVDLGYLYLKGIGVKADPAQAARWFQRAASSGSAAGKLNLVVLYLKGSGVPQDSRLAISLLNELAKHEDPRGEAYLGFLYMLGVGVGKDPRVAEHWFDKAAKHHGPEGEYAMGTLFSVAEGHEHDLLRAVAFLRESAQAGYIPSKHSLGLLLVNHPELPQSAGEATSLLETAASGGSWRSSVILGILYRDGKGVSKDSATSYKWFIIAGKQGGEKTREYVRGEVAAAKAALPPDQQQIAENSAEQWMGAHPNSDIFLLKGGRESAFFPIDEVYSTELAQVNSPAGASIR
jgi:TPR repeat protein